MNLIINSGSNIGKEEGFTNTHATAKRNAYEWFYKPMMKEGFKDIEVIDTGKEDYGRWTFIFKHKITGKEVELDIHGIDDLDAYCEKYIFTPKVYWNGGSSSSPELEQFAEEGFEPVMTFAQQDTLLPSGGDDGK